MIPKFKTISFNINNGVGLLELNQPPANQMTIEFFLEFNNLIDKLKNMPELKAMIISGRGRHFSSGSNLEELLEKTIEPKKRNLLDLNEKWEMISEKNYRSFLFLEELEIPVIAAIRGVCIGSAFELALSCHFRFCGEDSVLGLPETTFNLMPGLGGIRKLGILCGQAKAIELLLKGSTFGAEEALQYHLVDRIVPRRNVVEFSEVFARKVMKNFNKLKAPLYLQQILVNDAVID